MKISFLIILIPGLGLQCKQIPTGEFNFNSDWEFVKDADTAIVPGLFIKKDTLLQGWNQVSLPHTANIEPVKNEGFQWQGYCFYRKFFKVPISGKHKHIAINFEAGMQVADVYLNGKYVLTHKGGYLPFYVDITDKVKAGRENCVLVRLNNNDNPTIPPGKSLKVNGFPLYSGIYRNVQLLIKDKIHITDPVFANRVAGGGLHVSFSNVSQESAIVNVKTDVQNDSRKDENISIIIELKDASGKIVAVDSTGETEIGSGKFQVFNSGLKVNQPELWSPDNPYLYALENKVMKNGKVIEKQNLKIGIRTFSITSNDGFILNGQKIKLRGTNRHDEYPYIGMALSDNAHYRDAWKIKMAGFNLVRTSHYPQSNSFFQACDELGIIVMNPIPGFQFFGKEEFQDNSIQNVRDMVRRDRNHPSIMFWEASLNESKMSNEFMQRAHKTVYEEFPVGDFYTCGWLDGVYDVFIPARQHSKPPFFWNKYDGGSHIFIAEYGDWEYYAHNAGFNQTAFADLLQDERSSRQARGSGSRKLVQQTLNYMEAHNSNLAGNIIGDANWPFFEHIVPFFHEPVVNGNMDIYRLPKFSFYFYQSQTDPLKKDKWEFNKPMLFIANFWDDPSFKNVTIYSNCDEVELMLNGQIVSTQKPDKDIFSDNLVHPPFTFKIKQFEPGTLKAIGYIGGNKVVESEQKTPGNAAMISISVDTIGKPLQSGCNDIVFVRASITDDQGTVITDNSRSVKFSIKGDAKIIGDNEVIAEAGIASFLLQAGLTSGKIEITAESEGVGEKVVEIICK